MCRGAQYLVCIVLLLGAVSGQQQYTLSQKVDHFNAQDDSVFDQQYWVDDSHYEPGGPTLLYLTNFANPSWDLKHSAISEWASQLKAIAVELQVRYSGGSQPVANFSTNNLRFQTPEQNLADITTFRVHFLKNFPIYEFSPWIIIGEYYNANFALWAAEKYPVVFKGAVVVSGPVLATKTFPQYFEFWAQVAGEACSKAIHDATSYTELMLSDPSVNHEQIKNLYHCSIPDNAEFFYSIAQILQFGLSTDRDFVCSSMLNGGNSGEELMSSYGNVISELMVKSGLTECESWSIASSKNIENTFRPTFYMDCAAFGQFQVAGNENTSIISQLINYNWYLSVCHDVFGVLIEPEVVETNVAFGAKYPWGDNYAFITSTSDPYYPLTVNHTSLPNSAVFKMNTDESIFSFIGSQNPGSSIQETRNSVLSLMKVWLGITDISSEDSVEEADSSNIGLTIGIISAVIVCLLVLLLVAIGGFVFFKHKQRSGIDIID